VAPRPADEVTKRKIGGKNGPTCRRVPGAGQKLGPAGECKKKKKRTTKNKTAERKNGLRHHSTLHSSEDGNSGVVEKKKVSGGPWGGKRTAGVSWCRGTGRGNRKDRKLAGKMIYRISTFYGQGKTVVGFKNNSQP